MPPEPDPLIQAQAALQAGQYFEAYLAYRQALEVGPGEAGIWNNMGMALAQLGFWLAAQNRFRRALASSPQDPEVLRNLAAAAPRAEAFRQQVRIPRRDATVSVIVLTFNQLPYTRLCLESVFAKTPEMQELIIVDNASVDGTPAYLEALRQEHGERVRLILNPVNQGFAAGCNQGAALARGEHLLFLNNDVVVSHGWLARLLNALDKQAADLAGPCSRHISGEQAVEDLPAGFLQEEDILEEYAQQRALAFQDQGKLMHRLVGFCLLARRRVIDTIGGFDPGFGTGNFEDDDFCYRALLAGFRLWWAQDVFIHHFGQVSFQGAGLDYRETMQRNWGVFCRKWGLPADLEQESIRGPITGILEQAWHPRWRIPLG